MNQKCPGCGEIKDQIEGFAPSRRGVLGAYCRVCQQAVTRRWQSRNPEKRRVYRNEYNRKHRDEQNRKQREWRERNPEKMRERQARNRQKAKEQGRYAQYRHGIKLAERNAIQESQGNRCFICHVDLAAVKRVCIDHDYYTGAIRGILCNKCNTGLGWFETKRERIMEYLSRPPVHPGKPNRPDRKT